MHKSTNRIFFGLLAAATLVRPAWAETGDHKASMPGIAVEHAEVIADGSNGDLKGYFSVWNGSSSSVDLVSIESDAFGSVTLFQTLHDGGVGRLREVEGGLRIPAHSELLMTPGGVQLLFREPRKTVAAGQPFAVTLRFADGISKGVEAIVLAPETPVTDHHHGEGDGSGSD